MRFMTIRRPVKPRDGLCPVRLRKRAGIGWDHLCQPRADAGAASAILSTPKFFRLNRVGVDAKAVPISSRRQRVVARAHRTGTCRSRDLASSAESACRSAVGPAEGIGDLPACL